MAHALANPQAISLAAGFVDQDSLPVAEVQSALKQLFSNPVAAKSALQYGTNAGSAVLRQQIAQRYFANDPEQAADQMILTAGSNQLLQIASECLLDPGDIVLCAAPTYFVYLYVLRDIGARAHGVGVDDQGMLPDELERNLSDLERSGELSRVRLLYLVPYADNPAGTTMGEERRRQIIDVLNRWSDRASITLLVDNAYRDLRYEGEDIPAMIDCGADRQTTVETGTFSKNLSPGIRIGWGVAPKGLYQAIDRRKSIIDFGSPHFNQALVSHLIASGDLEQHIEILRTVYRRKRDAMLAACQQHFGSTPGASFQHPGGGLYVWLRLPSEVDLGPQGEIWQRALDAGVLYVPGEFFYAPEGYPIQRNTARLTFGVQSEEKIAQGIEIRADVIKSRS